MSSVIENGLHHIKDVACGEDRSLVHLGANPTIMVMLRDTASSLPRRACCRAVADHPLAAIALVVSSAPTRA